MKKILLASTLIFNVAFLNAQFDLALVNGTSNSTIDTLNCRGNYRNQTLVIAGNPSGQPITINHYLSVDNILDPSDNLVHTRNTTNSTSSPGSYQNVGSINMNLCRVSSPGTYYLISELISDNSLDTNLSNNIFVHPGTFYVPLHCYPQITNIDSDTIFCEFDSVLLTSNLPISLQDWIVNWGPGSLGTYMPGTGYYLSALDSGLIRVSVSYFPSGATTRCSSNGPFFYSIDSAFAPCSSTTSIEDELSENVTLYPNPSHGQINLKNSLNKNVKIDIIDINGKLIHSSQLIAYYSTKINLEKKGLFFIRITKDENYITKRIIIQ